MIIKMLQLIRKKIMEVKKIWKKLYNYSSTVWDKQLSQNEKQSIKLIQLTLVS